MIWKYAVTPLNNATDKNWITADDTTWTNIIQPYARKFYKIRPKVKNCKPGENLPHRNVVPIMSAAPAFSYGICSVADEILLQLLLTKRWSGGVC